MSSRREQTAAAAASNPVPVSKDEEEILRGLCEPKESLKYDDSIPKGRSSKDLDSEFEAMISAVVPDVPMRPKSRSKSIACDHMDMDIEAKLPRQKSIDGSQGPERYSERVLRHQANKEIMDKAVAAKYGESVIDPAREDLSKQTKGKDVDDSVLRVRAKLQALVSSKADFFVDEDPEDTLAQVDDAVADARRQRRNVTVAV